MRRLFLPGAFAFAIVLLVVAIVASRQRQRTLHPKVLLGDGMMLQVERLTWGTNQIFYREPRLWSALKRWLPSSLQNRVGTPLGPYPLAPSDRFPLLWLSVLNPSTGRYDNGSGYWFWTVDSSGQSFRQNGGLGSTPGRGNLAPRFEVMDWRANSLRFRVGTEFWTNEFEIPNPRRGERFPEWSSSPLPQATPVGDHILTLLRLAPRTGEIPGWKPELRVDHDGRDISTWFDLDTYHFVDSTGNRHPSQLPVLERVWGLELLAYPSANFPFPSGQPISLGKVRVPAAGKFVMLPESTSVTNAGIEVAWMSGSGFFVFEDGKNIFAGPNVENNDGGGTGPGAHWWHRYSRLHPMLWVGLRGPTIGSSLRPEVTNSLARILPRIRRKDGSIMKIQGQPQIDDPPSRVWFDLPDAKAGEILDIDLFVIEPLSVKFTFPAPVAQ